MAVGTAEAEAKRLAEMALVSPQIELNNAIGENKGYQAYLISIRGVEAQERIGIEQAKALQSAGIKVIANTGTNVGDGISSVGDLFTAAAGTKLGAAIEGLANTPAGEALLDAAGIELPEDQAHQPVTNGNSHDPDATPAA